MKSFFEQMQDEYGDNDEENLEDIYHDLVFELLDILSDNLDILPDTVTDLVFELSDVADELSDMEESTNSDATGDYKPKLIKKKDDEEGIEEMVAVKKKRDKLQQLQSRKDYRRNKSKIKSASRKLRKTSAYKKYKKKEKRLNTRGLTSTGKRLTKYI